MPLAACEDSGIAPDDHQRTEELEARQDERETAERRMADDDPTDAGTATHDRRADKAAYLKEKLAERAASERAAEQDD